MGVYNVLNKNGTHLGRNWNSGDSTVYRGDLISGCSNSVYRGILISGCSNSVYRGVLISGDWNRGVPLYTEVFSFQGVGIVYTEVSSFQGIGIEEFTVYRGVLISGDWNRGVHCIQRCLHFRVL